MTPRERSSVTLVAGAIALGVLADLLFRDRPVGVNAVLFAAAFVATLAVTIRVGHVGWHQGRRFMVAPLLLFATLLAWHDSPLLLGANLIAVAGAVTLGALRRARPAVRDAHVGDFVVGAASAGASTFVGAFELAGRDVPWRGIGDRMRGHRGAAVARGAALALPLLVLFGGLFVAADAVFSSLLESAVPDVANGWPHLATACFAGWLSAGLLRDLVAARDEERLIGPTATFGVSRLRAGPTELAVALGAVNLLFVAFVVVQVRYLFGGAGLVESRTGLTYAEYARHGFFELVVVALLVLPLILGAQALLRGRRSRVVQLLSGTLIALVLVVMASALERLVLYQREYGLTELRIYATGIIVWLGVVFVLLTVTVLRGRPRAFAAGALLSAFAATLALNAVNPDALIVRTNLSRPHVDIAYLGQLSDDAVPSLLERLPTMPPDRRRALATALLERGEPSESFLSWNAARAKSRALLVDHRAELVRYAYPERAG